MQFEERRLISGSAKSPVARGHPNTPTSAAASSRGAGSRGRVPRGAGGYGPGCCGAGVLTGIRDVLLEWAS